MNYSYQTAAAEVNSECAGYNWVMTVIQFFWIFLCVRESNYARFNSPYGAGYDPIVFHRKQLLTHTWFKLNLGYWLMNKRITSESWTSWISVLVCQLVKNLPFMLTQFQIWPVIENPKKDKEVFFFNFKVRGEQISSLCTLDKHILCLGY